MNIDKQSLISLRSEINAALEELAKRHGLAIRAGNGTYDAGGNFATFRLEVSKEGTTKAESQFASNFRLFKPLLPPEQKEWLGRRLSHNSKVWTLIGYNPKKKRLPFVVKADDGTMMFTSGEWVAARLEA